MDARFVYMKTVKTRMKKHENIFASKTLCKMKTFEKLKLIV